MTMSADLVAILFKMETVYGTDSVPTAGANGMLMQNVRFSPMEGSDVDRGLYRAFFGASGEIPAGLYAMFEGEVEVAGSGSLGVAPAWGPLMRICAFSQTVNGGVSVVYAPVSAAIESATAYLFINGTRQILTGCRGDWTLVLSTQGIPKFRFRVMGRYADPTDVALPAPTLTAWQAPLIASDTNTPILTFNGVSLVVQSYELDLGGAVQPRLLINAEQIFFGNRKPLLKFQCEAEPLATFNPFTLAKNQTLIAINLTHGTAVGNRVAVNCPTCQLKRPSGYERDGEVSMWNFEARPLPSSAGNDEFTITVT
jgi:hypothetical protein